MNPGEIAEKVLQQSSNREVRDLLEEVWTKDLTAREVFAVLAIFRGVKDRMAAQQRQPAPVLVVSGRKPQRGTAQGAKRKANRGEGTI